LKIKNTKIEDVLIKMGMPIDIKGFRYIIDSIKIFEKTGVDISVTKKLYTSIAKKNKVTPQSVERAIRYAFQTVRKQKYDYETINHYIGFANCNNSNSLRQLYLILKRNEEFDLIRGVENENID